MALNLNLLIIVITFSLLVSDFHFYDKYLLYKQQGLTRSTKTYTKEPDTIIRHYYPLPPAHAHIPPAHLK